MTRTRLFALGALPLALALVACGGDKLLPVGGHHLPAETACGDGYDNDRDGFVDCADLDCRVAGGSCTLAPALDRSVATTTAEAAAFLYTGSDPLQKGADPAAFDPRRVAMVRGKVVGVDRQPLAGVKISIVDHPEYGFTQSRGDGLFDMAVNGGARVLVRYELDGYLLAERASNPGWQRHARVPEVGLVARSDNQSRLSLDTDSYEVALGDEVADANGTRQPFVFFQSGTSATAELPNGDKQKLKDVTLSVTEYPFERTTADDYVSTARFAPGTLPLSGGLHYGLEFSIAEAEKLAARRVTLSEPAVIYVENFLGLPVGSPVPLGYYDARAGQWQGATGGRVVRILGLDDGRAVLDMDGDGAPDDEHALTLAKVSNEERTALAAHYAKDATLWRASVQHFSSWNMQFPVRPPPDAVGPTSRLAFARSLDQPTRRGPSVVERMALSQSVPITGTPYSLSYQSDRSSAYGSGFQFQLPLIGDEVPPGLKRVISSVEIAGQQLTLTSDPTAKLTRTVIWDGKDGFGRLVQGPQLAHVAVSFVFDGSLEVSDTFGVSGSDEADAAVATAIDAGDAVISQEFDVPLGVWDAKGYELGGFALDVLHAYDPASQAVYFGWGDERTAQNIALVVTRPGSDFNLGTPDSIAPAANGNLFVTDDDQDSPNPAGRVLEIDQDGQVFVVAGAGASGAAGELELDSPQGLVVKGDGTLLVADLQNDAVREIRPDGTVRTLLAGSIEDPVVEADLSHVDGIALGPREELYVVDEGRVLRVEGNSVSVFAGGNEGDGSGNVGDGGPAKNAILVGPSGIAAAPDGTVFISERGSATGGHRIRKVSPNGTISTVAGRGKPGFSGDGGNGELAELNSPRGLALAPDGSLYIADQVNNRIRRLTTDGIIQTIVGGGDAELEEGQLAEKVKLEAPDGIAVDRQGVLYIGAGESVYRVAPGKPELKSTEALVPSTDGRTLYRFDGRGRHEETIDAMTGVTELTLAYDAAGHLSTLKDKNGLTTTIERDGNGAPTAIVSPFQQRTVLELDTDGAISKVTDPIGRTRQFGFEEGRLRRAFDPAQGEHVFDYSPDLGLLKSVTEPNGYAETLEPQPASDGFSVLVSEPTGIATEYGVGFDTAGTLKRRVKYPTGRVVTSEDAIVSTTSKESDGSSLTTRFLPDDAFGAQALFPSELTVQTPSGKVLTVLGQRGKRLTDIDNRLSVEEWTEQFEINGRTVEQLYIAEDRTFRRITPAGRTLTTTLDERGRAIDVTGKGLPNVRYRYDDAGRVLEIKRIADGTERVEKYSYGDDGFLRVATDAADNSVTYDRDLVGRITAMLLPGSATVASEYDENDNLVSLTPPDREAHLFDFGGKKNLLTQSTPPQVDGDPAKGFSVGQTNYAYNDHFDLEGISRSDGQNLDFAYDPASGLLKSVTIPGATVSYSYDGFGELTAVNRSDSVKVSVTHDGPLWTGSTWSGAVEGSVTAKYDDNFFLASLTVNGSSTAKFAYDADGLMTSATANSVTLELERDPDTGFVTDSTLGTVTTATDYNGFGEPSRLRAAFQGDVNFTESLERDTLGRITHVTEVIGDATRDIDYDYDARGRLVEATDDGVKTEYDYDANGNRTAVTIDGDRTEAEYDGQDRLQSFGDSDLEQTAQGDLLRISDGDDANELAYDALGNLLSVTQNRSGDTRVISYKVDGFGRRVARQIDGKFDSAWFYRDALRPVGQLDAVGVFMHFIYTDNGLGGAPDFILRAGVPYRVIKDHLGSVRLVINAQTGIVEERLDYDAFGRVTNDTNPGFQPFGFAGGLDDPFTGLVHFGRRDYSPVLGRWLAKDPLGFGGGDTNVYAYCMGDPVNHVDPDGRDPKKSFWEAAIRDPIMCVLGNECTTLEAAVYVGTMRAASTALKISFRLWRTAGIFASVEGKLLQELAQSGVKHTPESIVGIARNAAGRIVFLETGTARSGLAHIIARHGGEFAAAGIPESEVGNLVVAAASRGTQIGVQSGGRAIFEVAFAGDLRHVAVTIADNGYIVGANMAH